MLAFVAAVLFTTLPRPSPLPDATRIDSITFHLGPGGCLQTGGALTIRTDGKISYFHQINMCMNHNDPVHKAEWEIPAKEAVDVIRKFVDAGLFGLPRHGRSYEKNTFTVTSGRWNATYYANPIPEKLMAVMQPLLEKAHPELWKVKADPNRILAKPQPTTLSYFEYSYHDLDAGHVVTVTLNRRGGAFYTRRDSKLASSAPALKHDSWNLEGTDASAKFLNDLVAAGIADLKDDNTSPLQHHIDLFAGDWRLTINPKELPEPIRKILQPLLDKSALPKK